MNPNARRLAAQRLAALHMQGRKAASDAEYADIAELRTKDAASGARIAATGEPDYGHLQNRFSRDEPPHVAVRYGQSQRTTTIDPMEHVEGVYGARAKEVVDTAIKHGAKPNLSPVDVKYEYIAHDDGDLPERGGEYRFGMRDRNPGIAAFATSPRGMATTIAHELSHHINDASRVLSAENLGPRSGTTQDGRPVYSSIPEVQNSALGRYVGGADEVQSRIIRKIKHWGAERGIVPKNEAEAKALLEQFGRDAAPKIPRTQDVDRAPFYEQQLLPRVLLHPFAPKALLQIVDAPSTRQLAAQRLANLLNKNGDA